MPHHTRGELSVVGQPVNLSRTPQPKRMRLPTPELGEHNDELMSELGYDAESITKLREQGAI
mgnify:CR=1 FL=1